MNRIIGNPVREPQKKSQKTKTLNGPKRTCPCRWLIERTVMRTGSGEREISRTITPLGLCKKNTAKRTVAYSPVRVEKRSDRFYGEVDRRLRKGGL